MVQFRRAFPLVVLMALSGCDLDYWWSRGQPPSSKQLFTRAASQVSGKLQTSKRDDIRKEIEQLVSQIQGVDAVLTASRGGSELREKLKQLSTSFAQLEGRLSYGQRASYGELSQQLTGFEKLAEESGTVDANVFALYSARTMFFLANELGSPAPAVQQ